MQWYLSDTAFNSATSFYCWSICILSRLKLVDSDHLLYVDYNLYLLFSTSGFRPSLPSRVGGLHHQPLQRHAYACDASIIADDFTVSEEETAAQFCVGWVSVGLGINMNNKNLLYLYWCLNMELLWKILPALYEPWHQWRLFAITWPCRVILEDSH